MPPTTPPAAAIVAVSASAAPGASEHALARAGPDLERGHGT